MPRPKRFKTPVEQEEVSLVDNVNIGLTYEQRLEQLRNQKDYYAFKYVKNKQGVYEGMYFCCNCFTTMKRLVKNWNKELDVCGAGPWEMPKDKKINIPEFDKLKDYKG